MLTHSTCTACGQEIHWDDWVCTTPGHSHPPNKWFSTKGSPCAKGADHIPERTPVESYTPEQINTALTEIGTRWRTLPEQLIAKLREMNENHVHDFTDTDTVTVKELRDAERRLQPLGFPGTVFSTKTLLREISSSREPEYPVGSVWEDANGICWKRISGKRWLAFEGPLQGDNIPKRPLRRMEALP